LLLSNLPELGLKLYPAGPAGQRPLLEFQDHPCFIWNIELALNAQRFCRNEAEARIIVRMAHQHHHFMAEAAA